MSTAYLGLGANLGDSRGSLRRAVAEIVRGGPRLTASSSVYRSPPEDFREQPDFLNQVIEVETDLPPERLLGLCLEVEDRMGRRREVPKGPRNIDIDLLLYEGRIRRTGRLILPHPAMHRRGFVLVPLCEIRPEVVHPALRRTAVQLLQALPDGGRKVVRDGIPRRRRAAGRRGPGRVAREIPFG